MVVAGNYRFRNLRSSSGSCVVDRLEGVGTLEGGARREQGMVYRSSCCEHPRHPGNSLYFCFQQEIGAVSEHSGKIIGSVDE